MKEQFYKWILFLILFSGIIQPGLSNETEKVPDPVFTISVKNKPIKDVLTLIENQSDFIFVYSSDVLDKKTSVSIDVKEMTIQKVLNQLFSKKNIEYKINARQIILKKKPTTTSVSTSNYSEQGKKKVTGTVFNLEGEPIIGATIRVKDASIGVISDIDGNFSIEFPSEQSHLIINYIGHEAQEVSVENKSHIIVRLKENTVLDELVVVGFGTQKKETVTGSISSITTKDLLQSPQANISNALAGRMAGLIAVQRSGEPGKDMSTIRIRGIGSFAKKQNADDPDPQDPLIMVDGIETSNFNDIDPAEIESFTILKDASATAVYGVRGANGVILITTQRGMVGKPQINFTTNVAFTTFPFLRKSMSSYDYASSFNKALAYDSFVSGSYDPIFSDEDIRLYKTQEDPIFHPNMDWYNYMLKDYSYQTQSNLNIRGGAEKVKYFVAFGYFTQEGMLNTQIYDPGYDYQVRYKRYNFRSNFDIQLTKDLLASIDISTQIGDLRNPNFGMGLIMDMLGSTSPISSPGIINNWIVTIPNPLLQASPPPVSYDKGWSRTYENNLNGSLRLSYKMDYLLKGLSLRGVISYKNHNSSRVTYSRNGVHAQAIRDGDQILIVPSGNLDALSTGSSLSKNMNIYAEAGVEYNRKFNDTHHITGLVLYNQGKFYAPNLEYLIPRGHQGLVGRATYSFRDRYLAEVNIGYNGTENFAPGNRFGFFPAYSLGWVLTEESFIPENQYVSFVKVRGSYGTVGNDKIGSSRFLYLPSTYSIYKGAYYPGEIGSTRHVEEGSREGQIGNPSLTWEKAVKMNIGMDIKFWNNKFGVTFDLFQEQRDNILVKRNTVPTIIGISNDVMPAVNIGEMKNRGFDGEFSFNDKIEKFNYFVKGNFTYAHNKIEFMDEVPKNHDYLYETGLRYGQWFGYMANGFYNTWEEVNDSKRPVYAQNNKKQPGDIRLVDINGDGIIDTDDQIPIGYSNFPEIMYGVSLGGNWKGFDFSILFQGTERVSYSPSQRSIRGFNSKSGANENLLTSWTYERYTEGLPIDYPRFSADNPGTNYALSTYWLQDGSYIRLKNAEIGYTFQNKFLKNLGLSSCRIYFNGNNLITWSKLFPGDDPESPAPEANNQPYPVTRVTNIGLNIKL